MTYLVYLFALLASLSVAHAKKGCGYWLKRPRTVVRTIPSPVEHHEVTLNQVDHKKHTKLELTETSPNHFELRFLESNESLKETSRPFISFESLRKVYKRQYRERGLLLAAALREFAKDNVTFGITWDGDQLNWREFEELHRAAAETIRRGGTITQTRGTWLTEFMRKTRKGVKGYKWEAVDQTSLPRHEEEDGSNEPTFDHYALDVVHEKGENFQGWHAHSTFRRRPAD